MIVTSREGYVERAQNLQAGRGRFRIVLLLVQLMLPPGILLSHVEQPKYQIQGILLHARLCYILSAILK